MQSHGPYTCPLGHIDKFISGPNPLAAIIYLDHKGRSLRDPYHLQVLRPSGVRIVALVFRNGSGLLLIAFKNCVYHVGVEEHGLPVLIIGPR